MIGTSPSAAGCLISSALSENRIRNGITNWIMIPLLIQSKNVISYVRNILRFIHVYTLCGFSRNTIMLLAFLTMRNHATYFSDGKSKVHSE